uniref:BTB domain-containing protein n=1 Tax=Panagrolaimus sp. ES5 TaxID=591445 RepID=A0AC34G5E5_9BILA
MDRDLAANTSFTTSYKAGTTQWNICLKTDYNAIVVKNVNDEEWDGSCFISFTLYYDAEMRFEFFTSTKIEMDEGGFLEKFSTPEGYMAKFIEAANNKKFSKCVIFIELHLPTTYFYEPTYERELHPDISNIIDELPDDYENDFRFEFLKNGDYTFECLDGTVLAQRIVLFLSSETMKNQLSSQFHHSVGIVKYTVDVIKPIITFFHSLCFKLPDSFNLDYIDRLLSAIEFFEPHQKGEMIKQIKEVISEKLVKVGFFYF